MTWFERSMAEFLSSGPKEGKVYLGAVASEMTQYDAVVRDGIVYTRNPARYGRRGAFGEFIPENQDGPFEKAGAVADFLALASA